jgi:hypothetical protein
MEGNTVNAAAAKATVAKTTEKSNVVIEIHNMALKTNANASTPQCASSSNDPMLYQ